MPNQRANPYRVLRVDPAAPIDVIETAYRRLARDIHPDRNASPDATKRMQELNEARAILRDPVRRAALDAALAPPVIVVVPPQPAPSAGPRAEPVSRPPPRPQPAPQAKPTPPRPPPVQATQSDQPIHPGRGSNPGLSQRVFRRQTPLPEATPRPQAAGAAQHARADVVRARMAENARRESALLGWGSIAIFAGWAVLLVNSLPPLLGAVTAGTMGALLGMAVLLTLPFGYMLDQLIGRSRGQGIAVALTAYFGMAAVVYVCAGIGLVLMPVRPVTATDLGPVLILGGLIALIHLVVALGLHKRTRAGRIGGLALATCGAALAALLLGQAPTWAGAALAFNVALIIVLCLPGARIHLPG